MSENKTLEIEEIKKELQLEKDNVAELNELLISVQQENEELKDLVNKKCAGEIYYELHNRGEKLEKIKEIASPHCSQCVEILKIIEE